MKIDLKEITVRELTTGYEDNEGAGIVALEGRSKQ
jgi:hypothetical protein